MLLFAAGIIGTALSAPTPIAALFAAAVLNGLVGPPILAGASPRGSPPG